MLFKKSLTDIVQISILIHIKKMIFKGWRRRPDVPDPRQQIKDDLWEKLTLELENPCDSDGHAIRIMRESHDSNVYEDSSRWFNHLGGEPLDPAASA
jgi:hypothetical protein